MTDFVRTIPADAPQACPDPLQSVVQAEEIYATKATEMDRSTPGAGPDPPASHPYHTQLS